VQLLDIAMPIEPTEDDEEPNVLPDDKKQHIEALTVHLLTFTFVQYVPKAAAVLAVP